MVQEESDREIIQMVNIKIITTQYDKAEVKVYTSVDSFYAARQAWTKTDESLIVKAELWDTRHRQIEAELSALYDIPIEDLKHICLLFGGAPNTRSCMKNVETRNVACNPQSQAVVQIKVEQQEVHVITTFYYERGYRTVTTSYEASADAPQVSKERG